MGTDIHSSFLRRLQKTAGFETTAVVGKAVIRQAFIRQMPASIRAHLATTPDSTSLESLAVLADRALASETDFTDSSVGVAEVTVSNTESLIGIMEDISRSLKKLDTSGNQKKQFNHKQQTDNRSNRTTDKQTFFANANAKPFIPRIAKSHNGNENIGQNVIPTNPPNPRSTAPALKLSQTGTAQPMATDDALICYYHQRFGDKAHLCRDPSTFALNC